MEKFLDIFPGKKTVFIAEIGINHNGDFDTARRMIMAASKAGADAVKFQTFVPEQMYSPYTNSLMKWGEEREADCEQINFFKKFVLSQDRYRELKILAEELGLVFFSSPFDTNSVDLLEEIDVPLYKVASSEVTNHVLLEKIAGTQKPVLMSTGISTEEEIGMAVNLLLKGGASDLILLHCVSLYPLPPERANLRRIVSLQNRFSLRVGFSDHSSDTGATVVAAALGARIFEKHFTLEKGFTCPDSAVSLDPAGFRKAREAVEGVIKMLGDGHINYDLAEKEVAKSARKSLFAARLIPTGKKLEKGDIAVSRPGVGIPVYRIGDLLGRKSRKEIEKDRLLREEYFE